MINIRNLTASVALLLFATIVSAQTATVRVDVDGLNDPPNAVDDERTTDQDTVLKGNVMDNDTDPDDGDTIVVVKVNGVLIQAGQTITLPSGALLKIDANGEFEYDPNDKFDHLREGESVQDSFQYEITNPPNDGGDDGGGDGPLEANNFFDFDTSRVDFLSLFAVHSFRDAVSLGGEGQLRTSR